LNTFFQPKFKVIPPRAAPPDPPDGDGGRGRGRGRGRGGSEYGGGSERGGGPCGSDYGYGRGRGNRGAGRGRWRGVVFEAGSVIVLPMSRLALLLSRLVAPSSTRRGCRATVEPEAPAVVAVPGPASGRGPSQAGSK
jgi:hypothetical protein